MSKDYYLHYTTETTPLGSDDTLRYVHGGKIEHAPMWHHKQGLSFTATGKRFLHLTNIGLEVGPTGFIVVSILTLVRVTLCIWVDRTS